MAMFDSAMNSLWAGMQAGLKNRPAAASPSAEPRLTLEAQMEWAQSIRDRVREVASPQDLRSVLSDINTFAPRLFPGGVDDLPGDLHPSQIQASFGINPQTGTRIPTEGRAGIGGTDPGAAATATGGQPAGPERTQLQGPPSAGMSERDPFALMTEGEIATARGASIWRTMGYGSQKAYLDAMKEDRAIMNESAAVLTGPQTADMFMDTLQAISGDAPPLTVLRDPEAFPVAIAQHQTVLQRAGFDQESIDSRIDRWWKVHDKMLEGMEARDAIQSANAERQEELFQDVALLTAKVMGVSGGELKNFDLLMADPMAALGSGHEDYSRVLVHAADLVKQDGMTLPQAYQALAERFAGKLDSWPMAEMSEEEKRSAPKTWPEKWREAFDEGVLPKQGFKYAMRNGRIIQYVVAKPDESGAPPEVIPSLTRYLSDRDLEVYRTMQSRGVNQEQAEEILAKEGRQNSGGSPKKQRQAGIGSPDTQAPELQRAGQALGRAKENFLKRFGIATEGEPHLQSMVEGGPIPGQSYGDLLFGGRYGPAETSPRAPLRRER